MYVGALLPGGVDILCCVCYLLLLSVILEEHSVKLFVVFSKNCGPGPPCLISLEQINATNTQNCELLLVWAKVH